MQRNRHTPKRVNDYEIAVIGAGGMGSPLSPQLSPPFIEASYSSQGNKSKFKIYDSDKVSEENLATNVHAGRRGKQKGLRP
ncbi:MAG: hypothetical protein Ct9H300mP10_04000 [Methanobacteriota archaeon]|nr:MAG: hypothetical protein Ct9H300mP10_04000 [Euryarchaeota archaeon]